MSLFDFEGSSEESSADDYEILKAYKQQPGKTFTGDPTATWYENNEKRYDSIRLRLVNEDEELALDCYANIPKPNTSGEVKRINRSFGFHHNAFNLFKSTIECVEGEELNIKSFKRINIFEIIDALNDAEQVTVEITKGADPEYSSFKIIDIE